MSGLQGSIANWPVDSTLQPTDAVLIRRPGAVPPEMQAPLSEFDARYALSLAAGTGIVRNGSTLSADGADHAGFARLAAFDPNLLLVAENGNGRALLPVGLLPASASAPVPATVPLEAFGAPTASDWTGPLNKALASGERVRLRPQTYLAEGDLTSGAAPLVDLVGTPGLSRIQRPQPAASGNPYVSLLAPIVRLSGIGFDMGGLLAPSPGWGVLVAATVVNFTAVGCGFYNHADPTLGSGLVVYGEDAPDENQRLLLVECEAAGNRCNGVWLTQVRNALVWGGRFHANNAGGLQVALFTGDDIGVQARRVHVQLARAHDNGGPGIAVGNTNINRGAGAAVYSIAAPDVVDASVVDCDTWNNVGYGVAMAAQAGRIERCTSTNDGTGPSLAAFFMFCAAGSVCGNRAVGSDTTFGLDAGQGQQLDISENSFDGFGIGMNLGGNLALSGSGNRLIRCTTLIEVRNTELSGTGFGGGFAQPTRGLRLTDTVADISASAAPVISILDGAQVELDGLDLTSNGGPGAAAQLISALGSLRIARVRVNGSGRVALGVASGSANGVNLGTSTLTVPDHAGEVLLSGSVSIGTVQLQTAAILGSGVAFWSVTAAPTGLTATPVVTVSTDGTGVGTPTPITSAGTVTGLITGSPGAGCTTATATIAPSNAVGTSGTATGQVGLPLAVGAPERRLRIICGGGGTILGKTVGAGGVVDLVQAGASWSVV